MTLSIKFDRKKGKYSPEFITRVRVDFHKGAAVLLPIIIQDLVSKGISPVAGVGRFKKYSKSYIDQIEGRVTFRYINGHAVPFKSTVKTALSIRAGKTTKSSIRKGANSKISIKSHKYTDNPFMDDLRKFAGKLKSPVNMAVTNGMMNSMKTVSTQNYTEIVFTSPLAKIHNDLGAGKSKVIRPLLPSKAGQRFTAVVNKKLNDLLNEILGIKGN